jgi:hypothetical protein
MTLVLASANKILPTKMRPARIACMKDDLIPQLIARGIAAVMGLLAA